MNCSDSEHVEEPRDKSSGAGTAINVNKISSSKKRRRSRSKYDILEEKMNSKWDSVNEKFEKLFIMFQAGNCAVHGDTNSKANGQSQRLPEVVHVVKQTQSLWQEMSDNEYENSDDNISIRPRDDENLGDSDNESDTKSADEEHLSVEANKCLYDLFDALTKKSETKIGIEIDDAKKQVLLDSWRTEHEDTEKCLLVPSIDDLISRCLIKKTWEEGISYQSSALAKTTLVSPVVATTSSLSAKTPTCRRSAGTGKEKSSTSESGCVSVNCMATIDQQFKTEGFSENARKLLSASWRAGTQKDYKAKFRKYNSWCSERDIDPYTASLEICANFLTHLFEKGLQYRTIAGYRFMLSSVLSPIEKIPVGQHPYIIRLLKGVLNTRLPKRKLVPEWDLPLVLDLQKKEPYESMKKVSLKYITWKTIFLIAITTFRRCGD
ncbi:unnamed protein product [Mytilus coruscus]|uniref:Core-binding (CB) domain-containing protein n=1 Tax=Mytilus coruscus TaxID=42192 RepID=A0A6J8DWT4_MYTCO|nr:unnamed protein product [Mytilus coruscus]